MINGVSDKPIFKLSISGENLNAFCSNIDLINGTEYPVILLCVPTSFDSTLTNDKFLKEFFNKSIGLL